MSGVIEKVVVVQDQKDNKATLMGVASSFHGDMVNFKVKYDLKEIDMDGFFNDLKETLAKDLDVPVSLMDVRRNYVEGKMLRYRV